VSNAPRIPSRCSLPDSDSRLCVKDCAASSSYIVAAVRYWFLHGVTYCVVQTDNRDEAAVVTTVISELGLLDAGLVSCYDIVHPSVADIFRLVEECAASCRQTKKGGTLSSIMTKLSAAGAWLHRCAVRPFSYTTIRRNPIEVCTGGSYCCSWAPINNAEEAVVKHKLCSTTRQERHDCIRICGVYYTPWVHQQRGTVDVLRRHHFEQQLQSHQFNMSLNIAANSGLFIQPFVVRDAVTNLPRQSPRNPPWVVFGSQLIYKGCTMAQVASPILSSRWRVNSLEHWSSLETLLQPKLLSSNKSKNF
jgi:hypothetical protein